MSAAVEESWPPRHQVQDASSCTTCVSVAALVLAFALLLTTPSHADSFEERYAAFQLLTNCEPMDLLVTRVDSDAEEIGLTTDSVKAAVESRLRSARLFDNTSRIFLLVGTTVVSNAFDATVRFNKPVLDFYSGEEFGAPTWSQSITGTHGGNGSYVLEQIRTLMDSFLVEFFRVNEQACGER